MDDLDRALAILIRNQIPLSWHPYEELAKLSGSDEAQVLIRLNRLQRAGLFFQIRALWNPSCFEYKTIQAAMKFPDSGLVDFAAKTLSEHPAIYYLERRPGEMALWFKMAVPVSEQLNSHIDILQRICGGQRTLVLPVRKNYKTREEEDLTLGGQSSGAVTERRRQRPRQLLSDEEARCIRILQKEIPIIDEPFKQFASQAGLKGERFLQVLLSLQKRNFLKKIAAVCKKKSQADESACFKVLWSIPDERVDGAAQAIVRFGKIIECQKKPVYPDWPYSLYADIQANDMDACQEVVQAIESVIGPWQKEIIAKGKVLKNTEIKYLNEDLQNWLRLNEAVYTTSATV
ncbi:MAG: hypothetical protein H6757_01465 [Candidatus Omnitrophica bacterium]|nr:hypothetical protein [Candidatus Omnitrophota bacterium]